MWVMHTRCRSSAHLPWQRGAAADVAAPRWGPLDPHSMANQEQGTHGFLQAAQAWLAQDPDPQTQAELQALLAAGDGDALTDRFGAALEFGTAGLRGVLGAGPNRMNRVVVMRTTAGLCAYLAQHVPNAQKRGLALGFDGRRMSREFAQDVAEVAAACGFVVHVLPALSPTPLLAFACLHLGTAGGVMVTASHNPPQYNGYKVYADNGAQIIPPQDAGIARCIAQVGSVSGLARMPRSEARAAGRLVEHGAQLEEAYLAGVLGLQLHPEVPREPLVLAYTALHGVGNRLCMEALGRAGFAHVHSVPDQAQPDASFPTVAFPNPEEKGAMDRVLAVAKQQRAHLVVANDPDADRLAVAVPAPDGAYKQLTGNDVGCLLAHYLLSQGSAQSKPLVVSSIVSSPMLGAIAAHHGARWEATLTGFKWISNRAMVLEREQQFHFVMGYEEALGYTISTLVRDKDGIGAAVVMADLAAWCAWRGKTVLDELEQAWRTYGLYLSRQVSVSLPGTSGMQQMEAIMDRVRAQPPTGLADIKVVAVVDLVAGTRRAANGTTTALELPSSNVIALELDGGHRVMLRPSGTEPKIKYYFDVCQKVNADEDIAAARVRGTALMDALVRAFEAVAAPPV